MFWDLDSIITNSRGHSQLLDIFISTLRVFRSSRRFLHVFRFPSCHQFCMMRTAPALCPCRLQLSLQTESGPVAFPVSKAFGWKHKSELLQPVSFNGFAFFSSPLGYKIHTVLCFCPQSRTWSGVLIPSPLRDHSPCISVQGYPTAVQLLEYSFPGRNSINLSWWKRCFWSGTWFTCSFSFRLGEWHLPAGVQTFTFPFPVLKRTEGPVSGDLSSWLAVRFLSAKYYPKESKQNQLTSPKVGAKDLEITFFCFHWLDNGTSSFFFLLSGDWCHLGYGRFSIFVPGCGTSWTHLPPPPQDCLVMDASPLLITTSANCPPDTFPANPLSSIQVLPCLDTSMALLSFGFFFF